MTAARARSRCASISAVNVSTSTSTPFSAAISAVSSNGKPYVSWSVNATRPSSVPPEPARRGELGLEEAHALSQRRAEALFLAADDADDQLAVLDDLGVRRAHQLDHALDEPAEEGLLDAEEPTVTHRAAQQPAQHVAAALVARDDAVGDQERHGARVVGDDAQRRVDALARRRTSRPVISSASAISERRMSVSKFEGTPCRIAAMRSRPMPVSMFGLGSGFSVPSSAGRTA